MFVPGVAEASGRGSGARQAPLVRSCQYDAPIVATPPISWLRRAPASQSKLRP
ncbi:MAG: hypothetical protein IPG04_40635 [Polyangiaceae bacterium]|nr:hypothetical protein [Polyangiaceae bacterium]